MIPFALPDISQAEIDAVTTCLASGWLTTGQKTKDFEIAFANAVGAEFAVAVNSATAAALLLLDSYGIGPGDEVIVPTITFSGPAMMAHQLGAKIVLADVKPGTSQIDPEDVARKITERTRVIMPTHFGGECCDLVQLIALTKGTNILLIDDAAHAFPTVNPQTGHMVGGGKETLATFFSFYATKCITTGEGGMITTDDEELAQRLRRLRIHGFSKQIFDRYTNAQAGWAYDIADHGWKANLTDMASSLGLAQLARSPEMTARRQAIAGDYNRAFRLDGRITKPLIGYDHAAHLYVAEVDNRDQFIKLMAAEGVQCSVHFIPLHHHSYWQHLLGDQDLPNADARYARSVSLPIFSAMTEQQIAQVVTATFNVLDALDADRN